MSDRTANEHLAYFKDQSPESSGNYDASDRKSRVLSQLIRRVASTTPARKVPSQMECGFCNLTVADCPERAAGDAMQEGETDDF